MIVPACLMADAHIVLKVGSTADVYCHVDVLPVSLVQEMQTKWWDHAANVLYLRVEAFVLYHFCANSFPWLLVQFVNGRADGSKFSSRHATEVHHPVQQNAMVDFDCEVSQIKFN